MTHDADLADAVETLQEAFVKYEQARLRQVCRALGEPYETDDGHGMRAYTWTDVVNIIESRDKVWRQLLERIEEVDPDWLDQQRQGLGMRQCPQCNDWLDGEDFTPGASVCIMCSKR